MDADVEALVVEHLDLVGHVVRRLAARLPAHVERAELSSAGVMGLLDAAAAYDGSRGVPFEPFAAMRVRGAVLDAMRAADPASRATRAAAREADAAADELAARLGRSATLAEVARAIDMAPESLHRLRAKVERGATVALDQPCEQEGEEPLLARLADPRARDPLAALEALELRSHLHEALAALPDRHRQVVVGYFLEGRTSAQIAEDLGVTESRVSQLRSAALEMLRRGLEELQAPGAAAPPVRGARGRRAGAPVAGAATSAARPDLRVAGGSRSVG